MNRSTLYESIVYAPATVEPHELVEMRAAPPALPVYDGWNRSLRSSGGASVLPSVEPPRSECHSLPPLLMPSYHGVGPASTLPAVVPEVWVPWNDADASSPNSMPGSSEPRSYSMILRWVGYAPNPGIGTLGSLN